MLLRVLSPVGKIKIILFNSLNRVLVCLFYLRFYPEESVEFRELLDQNALRSKK